MLVSLLQMKSYLGISFSDSTYDAFLNQQIALVSDTIEEYCRRKFKKATYLQSFYLDDVSNHGKLTSLFLRQFPSISITSILRKDKPADTGEAVTDYRLNKPSSKIISECGDFFGSYKLLEVTYTAGYESGKIPSPVLEVVYSLVQERYNKKKSGVDLNFGSNIQAISIPGTINVQYDFSLETNTRSYTLGTILGSYVNILDSYRSENAVIGSEEVIYNDPA